jgi:hypothetical protein
LFVTLYLPIQSFEQTRITMAEFITKSKTGEAKTLLPSFLNIKTQTAKAGF